MATRKTGPFAIRGLMVDLARQIDRHAFYFDLLDSMARWGLNTLWWHFADDQGFHLKLDSHPEIASRFAFTKDEMAALLSKAARLGIDIVPEVESLGHARYITGLPPYAHLADGDPTLFNAICPSHPQTLELLAEIIREVASVFPGPWFHAGLDEVNLGACPRCRGRSRGKPAWWIYAQHACAVHRIVSGCGKRMILWADHVEQQPALLKVLPKDILLAQWQYGDIRRGAFERSAAAGFQSVGAPALCHWGDLVHPNAQNFRNMDDMARTVAGMDRRQVFGVVTTWWTGWRGLRDAYLPAVAYAGRILASGRPVDKNVYENRLCHVAPPPSAVQLRQQYPLPAQSAPPRAAEPHGSHTRSKIRAMRAFARDDFGVTTPEVGKALWHLHEWMLQGDRLMALAWASPQQMHVAAQVAEEPDFATRQAAIEESLAVLEAAEKKVRRRRDRFHALVLAARTDAVGLRNAAAARELFRLLANAEARWSRGADLAPNRAAVRKLLARRLAEVDRLARQVGREWDRTRFPDDPTKQVRDADRMPCHWDGLLGKLVRCRCYLRSLMADMALLSPSFR